MPASAGTVAASNNGPIFYTRLFCDLLSSLIKQLNLRSIVTLAMPKSSICPIKPRAPPRADGLLLDNQLCFTLYATSLAMTKVYRPLLAPLGLTYPQYIVMLALWEHTELSAGALGERVALDSGTLVPLVRKLTALGYAVRRRSPTDDRSVLISLTPAGRQLSKRARAVNKQIACATQRSDAQIQVLMRSLKSLRAALQSSADAPSPATRSTPSTNA